MLDAGLRDTECAPQGVRVADVCVAIGRHEHHRRRLSVADIPVAATGHEPHQPDDQGNDTYGDARSDQLTRTK